MDLARVGKQLILVGAEGHGTFLRALEESLLEREPSGALRRFDDLDPALEWCENRILAATAGVAGESITLAEHEMCTGLGPESLAILASLLQPRSYPQGALIVREGDPAEEIFLLMRGLASVTVDLPNARRRRLSTLSPGMVFGELTIVDRSGRTADVRADTPVECLVLPAGELDQLGERDPRLKIAILTNLLRNVHKVVARLGSQMTALGG